MNASIQNQFKDIMIAWETDVSSSDIYHMILSLLTGDRISRYGSGLSSDIQQLKSSLVCQSWLDMAENDRGTKELVESFIYGADFEPVRNEFAKPLNSLVEVPYVMVMASQTEAEFVQTEGKVAAGSDMNECFMDLIVGVMRSNTFVSSSDVDSYTQFWDNYYFDNSGGYGLTPFTLKYFYEGKWVEFKETEEMEAEMFKRYQA